MQQSNETFALTDSAAARISHLLANEPAGAAFVISVLGGGCSGFQYNFDLTVKQPEDSDIVVGNNSARVIVDNVSMGLLQGSVLDYTEDLAHAGFSIKNPNATAKCGCGNSFSV